MIISIDLSLRSTGIVALQEHKLIDFAVISSANGNSKSIHPVHNNESLLVYNAEQVCAFIQKQNENYALDGIVIEGLSFGGLSGAKDIIQGNFWNIRCELYKKFIGVPIGICPVTSWRSKTLNKAERAEALAKYGKKLYLKQGVYDKLPDYVKERFVDYVKLNKLKKDSLFDLSDAYFLGIFRMNMEE